jgi:hypothetical protein
MPISIEASKMVCDLLMGKDYRPKEPVRVFFVSISRSFCASISCVETTKLSSVDAIDNLDLL